MWSKRAPKPQFSFRYALGTDAHTFLQPQTGTQDAYRPQNRTLRTFKHVGAHAAALRDTLTTAIYNYSPQMSIPVSRVIFELRKKYHFVQPYPKPAT